MAKIFRWNNRLALNIPTNVAEALGLKDGDEVKFYMKKGTKIVSLAKPDDIAKLLGNLHTGYSPEQARLSDQEIEVLRRLDTIRYGERTDAKVKKTLTVDEFDILKSLLEKKAVTKYKKEGETEPKYSIPRSVYNEFLFGKRAQPQAAQEQPRKAEAPAPAQPKEKKWESILKESDASVTLLETKGYIVVQTDAEAASLSSKLEDSIRRGLVLGIRAFNRKFYVVLRDFINQNAPKITKLMGSKGMSVTEIAKAIGVDEDGVRAILYLMSESGEFIEVRRDVFKLA
ncbi:MAG: hypothetical protein KGH98_03215 [Candidatus Micrarchaeota archaeon]|nr:hypothetical protein [Candidatus Micrarchaeota archaeon]